MTQYYKPTLIKENPLPLQHEDLEYAKELLEMSSSNDGFIPVKLEQDVVVQRISHDLYAKPESGFRELYNNEVRACRNAQKMFGAKPRIEISLDPMSRELEIRGIDSTGISTETFKNIYTVVGRSDNFSGDELGQFGFGRISYPTLSDIMVLETKYRTQDGKSGEYAIMGKNGIGFNVLPKPSLESFGTAVKLVLKPEINIPQLVKYIREACMFSGVQTYLSLPEEIVDSDRWSRNETLFPKGITLLNKKYEERAEEEAREHQQQGELVKSFLVRAEGAELYGEFRIGGREYNGDVPSVMRYGKDTRLIGSPIEIGIDLPFSYFILNVLDERRFQPTADRERLREESAAEVQNLIKPKVAEVLSSFLNVTTLHEFRELDEGKKTVLLLSDGRWNDEDGIDNFLPEGTRRLRTLLLRNVRVYNDKESSRRHGERSLASIVRKKEPNEIFFAPTGTRFNYNHIGMILEEVPGAVFIQVLNRAAMQDGAFAEQLLREQGVLSTSEYVEINKPSLKRHREPRLPDSIPLYESLEGYYSWNRFAKPTRHIEYAESSQTLPENAIRLKKGSIRKYTSLLSRIMTAYRIARDYQHVKGGVKLEDFVKKLADKKLDTSKGKISFKQILRFAQSKKKIRLYLYSDPEIARYFKDSQDLMIFAREDDLFQVSVFLTHHSMEFSLDTEMRELFDSEMKSENVSRYNFIRDSEWDKLGDSEILGSVMHVFKEVSENSLKTLFAKAVEGSKQASEVVEMRRTMLHAWKRIREKVNRPNEIFESLQRGSQNGKQRDSEEEES